MKNKIILISGKGGSGKTTTAHKLSYAIRRELRVSTVLEKFAGPIYEMARAIGEIAIKNNIKSLGKDRELMIFLGAEWGRNKRGENTWVNCAINRINNSYFGDGGTVFIFDDARYLNEITELKKHFGESMEIHTVRLICNKEELSKRGSVAKELESHESETQLDKLEGTGFFDLEVRTDYTSLDSVVEQIMSTLD